MSDATGRKSEGLVSVAEALYVLPPGQFTAARNDRAKEAKNAGEKELAQAIGRLPKPSASAWVVNLLARHRPDDVAGVLELGDALRSAQDESDWTKLKQLSRQRHDMLQEVAEVGAQLAEDAGQRVNAAGRTEVEQTLQAAMADPDAAAAVHTGRLIRALASTGVEPVDLSDAVAGLVGDEPRSSPTPAVPRKAPQASPPSQPSGPSQREVKEARRQLEAARKDAERARTNLEYLDQRQRDVETRRSELGDELAELLSRANDIQKEIGAMDRETTAFGRDHADAESDLVDAERAAREALYRWEEVSD
ncbi:MAG: hypothetical protein JWQ59_1357 [Cryobacterium sp.]|nr:hypothetical protein [Cryobacterium sp.]